jgi:uncharacterized membrane protein
MSALRWSSLFLAAFALSSAAHAQTTFDTYRLTRIGVETFGIVDPVVSDINENGEMSATTQDDPTGPERALLLRDGMVIELGDLMGGASPITHARAINDLTQITGTTIVNSEGRGFLWEAGVMRDLGIERLGGVDDINNRGQIVGNAVSESGSAVPILWEDGRTTFLEPLPCPGSQFGVARAINENGVIVGQSAGSVGTRAVMWRNGEVMVLPPTGATVPLEDGEALDVNDRDEAVGRYARIGEEFDIAPISFLWSEEGVTVLPPLDRPEGSEAAIAVSINNQGQVVGITRFGSGATLATLWQEGAVVELNALISDDDPLKPFVTLAFASKITESGLIIASGQDSREPPMGNVTYLLTPTGASITAASLPPSSSSDTESGGGAVDLLSLLLLVLGVSSFARSQRARCTRPFG